MKCSSILLLAAAGTAAVPMLTTAVVAQDDLATLVEQRQQRMKSMSKSFGPIIPILKGESTDLAAATQAANVMHNAIVEAVEMFPPGTGKGEVEGSRAKPEIWTEAEEFEAAAQDLINATRELAAAGETGDIDAFRAAFQPMGAACGGCHRGPSEEGGKFRFPKE